MYSGKFYMRNNLRIMIVITLFIQLSGSALGATPITQCGEINSMGDYELTGNIWNAGNAAVVSCINITSSNVNFEAQDHFVIGNSAVSGSIGVLIHNATDLITNVTIKNITLHNFEYGFYVENSSNSNLTSNNASNNSNGIYLINSANNFIYNNYFNNSINAISDANFNYWNTTKISGINIIDGSNLGGNFWAGPDGNGFSQMCTNNDGDGICDQTFEIGANNIDHLPLTNITTTLPGYRFINGTVRDNVTHEGLPGVTVTTNIGNSTITNPSGFYSFNVTPGSYQLTATIVDIRYYTNDSVTVYTGSNPVVIQDIDLIRKPTGTINGKVVRYSFVTISSPQDTIYHITEIPLVVSADRAISVWNYNLNGAGDVSFDPALDPNITAGQGWNDLVVSARDTTGKWDSNAVSFLVDSIPPESVTDLHNVSYATNYINWTWADPEDIDFAKVMVYLDGEYQEDVDKGVQFYNASGLIPGRYTIGTRTVDLNGTINATMVTNTSTTIMPIERYINGTVIDKINRSAIAGVLVSTIGFSDMTNETGFYSLKVVSGSFDLTATLSPTYYTNSSIMVSTQYRAVVIKDIELEKKLTGNITGSVTIANV
jgi:parallel beta-helix repeat protein